MYINRLCVMTAIAVMIFGTNSSFAAEREIKVFVKGFVNESGQSQIKEEEFKKAFESALSNRRSIKFKVMDNREAADMEISGSIKKYQYLKDDHISSFAGAGGLILDAVTSENYAEIEVTFNVIDTKTGKTLWDKPVKSYVEDMMTPEASIPLVYDKVSRQFLWKCFGKGK